MVRLYSGAMTSPELDFIAACSLDADGMAARASEIRALLAPNLRELRRTASAAQLDFDLDEGDERARARLLDLERECCPFWRFSLTRRAPDLVRLDVRAEAPYEPAVEAFLTLTRDASGQAPAPAPEEPSFRAGEAARRAGVGVETLRYYERRGLLPAPPRRPSGQREYGLEHIRLVRAIKTAQHLGFTLAQTKELVRVTRRGAGTHVTVALRDQVEAKLREVNDKIRGLELLRAELRAVLAAECDALVDCDCGDDCPIEAEAPPAPRRLQVIG